MPAYYTRTDPIPQPDPRIQIPINDGYYATGFGTNVNPESSKGVISSNPGYGPNDYDVCMVFPVDASTKKGFTKKGEECMRAIRASGAQTYAYYDVQGMTLPCELCACLLRQLFNKLFFVGLAGTKIFVLLRYLEDKLSKYADFKKYRMKLGEQRDAHPYPSLSSRSFTPVLPFPESFAHLTLITSHLSASSSVFAS